MYFLTFQFKNHRLFIWILKKEKNSRLSIFKLNGVINGKGGERFGVRDIDCIGVKINYDAFGVSGCENR